MNMPDAPLEVEREREMLVYCEYANGAREVRAVVACVLCGELLSMSEVVDGHMVSEMIHEPLARVAIGAHWYGRVLNEWLPELVAHLRREHGVGIP